MNSFIRFFVIGAFTVAFAGNTSPQSLNLPPLPASSPIQSTFLHMLDAERWPGFPWAVFQPFFAGDPPTATDDVYEIDEDNTLTVDVFTGVLANDTDPLPGGETLTATVVLEPSNGEIDLQPDGSFTYTPDPNFFGTDTFTYTANDPDSSSAPALVTITVAPINDPPVAHSNGLSVDEDDQITLGPPGLLGNDTDPENDPLIAHLETGFGPSYGSLALNSDGSLMYTPIGDFYGSDSFQYHVNDGDLDSAPATVTITVNPVNDSPDAANDSYSVDEDDSLTIASPGVLANDHDVEGDAFTAEWITDPSHGSLTLNSAGGFTYTPTTNYSGPDSFTYRAVDSNPSTPATVSLTVNPLNDPPTGSADTYSTVEDTPLTAPAPGVLQNDNDIDGDPLTPLVSAGPTHGSLTLNPNGSFTYIPAGNYHGPDTFSYTISDGAVSAGPFSVSINVTSANDAPSAAADNYPATEDTLLSVAAEGVLSNDTDIEGSPLTAALVTDAVHGDLNLLANGSFTYQPEPNYNGPDSFTYHAWDGADYSNTVTVTLAIAAVNDAPTAGPNSYTTPEDTPLTAEAPGLLENDTDVESSPLTAVLYTTSPANGDLTLNANGSFTYSPNANFNGTDSFSYRAYDGALYSEPVIVSLSITAVNDLPVGVVDAYSTPEDSTLSIPARGVLINDTDVENETLTASLEQGPVHGVLSLSTNGAFIYTPTANYNGPDSFTYFANDAAGKSAATTVSLSVTPVNDAPVAVGESYSTAEDTPLIVTAPGLLANDSDIDSAVLTSTVDTGPAHGSVVIDSAGSFTYTPALNYHGPDLFTYRVSDGSLNSATVTVTLTVTAVNDRPLATGQAGVTLAEDSSRTITLSGTDVDNDVTLTYQLGATAPGHGQLTLVSPGVYTYAPALNYFGPDSFSFTASDGLLTSTPALISLTITAVNDAPVGVSDSAYTIAEETDLVTTVVNGVLANDSDVDNATLTAVPASQPQNGILTFNNANGTFRYIPNRDFYGVDTFTYRASDGALSSALTTVTITVANVNDAPVAIDDSYTTNEDTPIQQVSPGVQANDYDVDRIDTLSVVIDAQPTHGTLVMQSNGAFSYTPIANYNGVDFFTYHLNDGQASSTVRQVSLTIVPINDVPITTGDYYAVSRGGILHVDLSTNLLSNDRDIELSPLRAVLLTTPVRGVISSFSEDGTFTYTTYPNAVGAITFTYAAVDEQNGTSTPTTVTIDVAIPTDIEVEWLSPLKKKDPNSFGGYWVGTETIKLRASFGNCPPEHDCVIRYYRLDKTLPSNDPNRFKEIGLGVAPDYTYDLDTSILPYEWNEIMAQAIDITPFNPSDPNFHGTDLFTYRVYDGVSYSEPAQVTIAVTPEVINPGLRSIAGVAEAGGGATGSGLDGGSAPAASDDAYASAEDQTLTIAAPGVLGNDNDADDDPLTAVLISAPAHGNLTVFSPTGAFTYVPDANFTGSDNFSYQASDGDLTSTPATVTITVAAVNDLPVAIADSYTVEEKHALTVPAPGLLVNDIDFDADRLTASVVSNPSYGVLDLKSDGLFKYTSFPVGASPRLSIFLYRYPELKRLYFPKARR